MKFLKSVYILVEFLTSTETSDKIPIGVINFGPEAAV